MTLLRCTQYILKLRQISRAAYCRDKMDDDFMKTRLLDSVAATTAHRDRDELDRAVVRLLLQFLEAHSVTLLRLIDDGQVKRVAHRVSMNQQDGELPTAAVGELADLPALADYPAWQECALRGELVQSSGGDGRPITLVPIRGERDVVGLLVIESATALSRRETDLTRGIVGIVRNHLALLDYGELDTLTGLLNRKTFEGYFEKLRQRANNRPKTPPVGTLSAQSAAAWEPSWLAIIDIDHFKAINDGYGHLFGDEVLLLVSQLMKHSFRGADHLFRFGGEEFVVVLEHASDSGARIVLERLREKIAKHNFPQVGHLTVSIGYTLIDRGDISTTCVGRADAALYYAKGHGRNNVQNCESLIAEGKIASERDAGDIELF